MSAAPTTSQWCCSLMASTHGSMTEYSRPRRFARSPPVISPAVHRTLVRSWMTRSADRPASASVVGAGGCATGAVDISVGRTTVERSIMDVAVLGSRRTAPKRRRAGGRLLLLAQAVATPHQVEREKNTSDDEQDDLGR